MSTRVIYVDKETFIPFLHDIYDPNNKLWKTYFFLQGIVPINPQENAYLHDAFNDSIYDLQNKHMSLAQVAMPGVSANQYTPEVTRTQESTLACGDPTSGSGAGEFLLLQAGPRGVE